MATIVMFDPIVGDSGDHMGGVKQAILVGGAALCSLFCVADSNGQDFSQLEKAGAILKRNDAGNVIAITQFMKGDGAAEHFEKIEDVPGIENLEYIMLFDVSDAGIEKLQRLDRLPELSIGGPATTDRGLESIAKMKGLHSVSITSSRVSEGGLEKLLELPKLTDLDVTHCNVTNQFVGQVVKREQIESLSLSGTSIDDDAAALLSKLPKLRKLDVTRTQLTDEGLKLISGLNQLEELSIGNEAITNAGIAEVSRLPRLKSLMIDQACGDGVDNDCLESVKTIKTLEKLILLDRRFDRGALKHLSAMRQLKELWVGNTSMGSREVTILRAVLPNCEVK